MSIDAEPRLRRLLPAASNPGMARHFRVQFREVRHDDWRMFAAFRRRDQAEACLGALEKRGLRARVVDCDRCPTAA